MPIVPITCSIKIPIKVEKFLAMNYPHLSIRKIALYSALFRIGAMVGKKIELWNRFEKKEANHDILYFKSKIARILNMSSKIDKGEGDIEGDSNITGSIEGGSKL